MALCRLFNSNLKILNSIKNNFQIKEILNPYASKILIQERYFRKSYGQILKVMRVRRKLAGPDRVRKRNEWDNWNYNAELYAFNKRLNENISENTLRCAFVHESYLICEEEKRKSLEMPSYDVPLDLKSNTSLIDEGHDVISNYLKPYLRLCFEKLPEEGITAVHDHLLSDEVMSHVASNLGTKDLILCAEYPPNKSTFSSTLKAIIGSISRDDSVSRAENFVLDFICPQLIAKDIFEIWDLQEPLTILNEILIKHGLQQCEPRLIFESGRTTIEAIYHVGLYSNQVFLGRGPGETLDIAVEMAAYDCLRKFFGITEHERPIPIGGKARHLDLKSVKQHFYLKEWHNNALNYNEIMRQ